ncbi:hypothetical protein BDZ97DRAFT_1776820 [Flammula alnicola]|nr:hypothetical protein BDZ97DRAFT_1776820 [Flammula alnicola]
MGKSRKTKRAKTPEEVYHVEVVTKAHVVPADSDDETDAAKWEYFVKWAGYESDANSWEPESNLEGCKRLLSSFWEHVGLDNRDYLAGYEVKASKEWIEKEKAFFAKEYRSAQEEIKRQQKEQRKQSKKVICSAQERKGERHTLSRTKDNEPERGSSSEEDRPLKYSKKKPPPQEAQQSLSITIPGGTIKKRKLVVSSSSDEEPLQSLRPTKVAKTKEVDRGTKEIVEIPSSPEQSPTSLFSVPSSPDIALANKEPQKKSTFNTGKDKALPSIKIMRRSNNPQAKIADMAPSEIPSSSGISTKQRLAQGALAPTLPKQMPATIPKPPPKPLPTRTPSTSLMGLSFKKKSIPPLAMPTGSASRPEAYFASLNSPAILSPQIQDSFFTSSPDTSFSGPSQNTVRKRPSVSEPTISPALISQFSPMAEAETFLRSIMPPSLAAPMESEPEHPSKVALPGRIHKMWKWTGPLFLNSTENALCNVKIHNLTKDQSLRYSIVFQSVERMEVLSMYDNADLRAMLSVFRKPPQLGLLSPDEEKDAQSFNLLIRYMEKSQKVFLVPIILDDNIIGQVVFFPYLYHMVLDIEVPRDLSERGHLVTAILPYALSPAQLKQESQVLTRELGPPLQPMLELGQWDRSLRTSPHYHHALRVLDTQPGARERMETRLLQRLLNQVKAKNAGHRSEARVVFVHVGALGTVHKLADFVERRANHHMVQFYTYGTDPDVSPSMWSITEIWPCGGIVTFTPSAMLKDPILVCQRIIQISRHPAWACYILPLALGLLAKLECGDEDPVKMLEQRKLGLESILQMIEDGAVALIQAPPEKRTIRSDNDVHAQWLSQYIAFIPPTKREALETGIMAFLAAQGLRTPIEAEISADLSRMQRHPAFMTEYRRYVVINFEDDGAKVNTYSDGFEWTTAAKFDFKDDYYPKQTIGIK